MHCLRVFLAAVLAIAGIALFGEFAVTLLWQDPMTYFTARAAQHRLNAALARQPAPAVAPAQLRAALRARRRAERAELRRARAQLARRLERGTADGGPLGLIEIPRIGARFVFVQGTSETDLQEGPGHYLGTVLPGQHGTVGIAGHRTTYLAPFRHIDDLRHGDRIVLLMPYGRYTYRVEGTQVVSPVDTGVLRNVAEDRLVLSACHPLFSAAERIVVTARLAS